MSILTLFNGRIVNVESNQSDISLTFGTREIPLLPNAVIPTGNVAATDVNHNDLFILTGTSGFNITLPAGLRGFIVSFANKSTVPEGGTFWRITPQPGELIEGPALSDRAAPSTTTDPLIIDEAVATFSLAYTNATNGWQILNTQ